MFNFFSRKEKTQYPDGRWFRERACDNWLTPDLWKLEESSLQKLFVYDDHMMGFNSRIQELGPDANFCFQAFTKDPFTVLKTNLRKASFPIPLEDNLLQYGFYEELPTFTGFKIKKGTNSQAILKGEVWVLPPKNFVNLDILAQNGVYFDRKQVKVLIPYHEKKWSNERGEFTTQRIVEELRVWMYVGRPDYWNSIADSQALSQVGTYTPNKPILNSHSSKFYFWTPKEYDL